MLIMQNLINFLLILICVCVTFTYKGEPANIFKSSIFIFYDDGNRLPLNNEVTTLKFWCSGAIVASRWSVSAASCFNTKEETLEPERYVVVPTKGVRIYSHSKGYKSYELKKIIFHDEWEVAAEDGVNIALLLQDVPFSYTNSIGKASLSFSLARKTLSCKSLVWLRERSRESEEHVVFLPKVLEGQIHFKCLHKKYFFEFCFVSTIEEETCYDVQGSLLWCNGRIQGIASSKYGGSEPLCANSQQPTQLIILYADMGIYNMWIYARLQATSYRKTEFKNNILNFLSIANKGQNDTFLYMKLLPLLLFFLHNMYFTTVTLINI